MKTQRPTPKGAIERTERKRRKESSKSVKFDGLEPSANDPVIEEIPENEVNVETRQVNLTNELGVGDWERKNRAEDCPGIIDTGCNGWGGFAAILGCESMLNT